MDGKQKKHSCRIRRKCTFQIPVLDQDPVPHDSEMCREMKAKRLGEFFCMGLYLNVFGVLLASFSGGREGFKAAMEGLLISLCILGGIVWFCVAKS